jgi:hypothetical protein
VREHRELKRPEPTMPIVARLFYTWTLILAGAAAFMGGVLLALWWSGVIE